MTLGQILIEKQGNRVTVETKILKYLSLIIWRKRIGNIQNNNNKNVLDINVKNLKRRP